MCVARQTKEPETDAVPEDSDRRLHLHLSHLTLKPPGGCVRTHVPTFFLVLAVSTVGLFFFFLGVKMGESDQFQFSENVLRNNTGCRERCDNNRMEYQAHLRYLKSVTLTVVGFVGVLIIGCLCFCMFYKNERLLTELNCKRRPRHHSAVCEICEGQDCRRTECSLQFGIPLIRTDELNIQHSIGRNLDRGRPQRSSVKSQPDGKSSSRPASIASSHHHHHRHKPVDDQYLCVPGSGLGGLLSNYNGWDRSGDDSTSITGSDASSFVSDVSDVSPVRNHWSSPWTGHPSEPLPDSASFIPVVMGESERSSDEYCCPMSHPSPATRSNTNIPGESLATSI